MLLIIIPERAVAYKCPSCQKNVVKKANLFSFASGELSVACDCGRSELSVKNSGGMFVVEVPCVHCHSTHRISYPRDRFFKLTLSPISCIFSDFVTAYVGYPEEIPKALDDLDRALNEMLMDFGSVGNMFYDDVMFSVLSSLQCLAEQGRIRCTCGSNEWDLLIGRCELTIECGRCGAKERISARTTTDAETMGSRESIDLCRR